MAKKMIFLNGSNSLANEAASELLKMVPVCRGTADFQGVLVALPTREAGRVLREALLKKLSGGMMNFRTIQPAGFFRDKRISTASALECARAWLAILPEALKKGLAERLFPLGREVINQPEILLNLAETLQRCRITLAGEGYTVPEAAALLRKKGGEDLLEKSERFDDFSRLESMYLAALERQNSQVCDPAQAILKCIARPELPGINQLVIIACPQLSRGMRLFLDQLPEEINLTIAADAIPEYGKYLDEYGCPEIQGEAGRFWKELDCGIEPEKSLRFTPDTFGLVRAAERFLEDKNFRPGAIGVLDNEAAGLLLSRSKCGKKPYTLFKPENTGLSGGVWTGLLLELLSFFNHPDAELTQVIRLLHSGKFGRFLENKFQMPLKNLLRDLDTLQSAAAVDNLYDWCTAAEAKFNERSTQPESRQIFRYLLERHRTWQETPAGNFDMLLSFWQEIGEQNLANLSWEEAETEAAELAVLLVQLKEMQNLAASLPEAWQPLLRYAVSNADMPPVIPEKAVELTGFAELNWREEEALLIIGFNEENFHPDTGADNLLPERFRLQSGMTVEANRYAADVLRLSSLVRRHPGNKLIIYAAGKRMDGSILHPARLLLQCPDKMLPQRLRLLMPELGNRRLLEEFSAPDETPEPLVPHLIPHFSDLKTRDRQARVSVTDVTTYLQGPFRFWRSKLGDKIVDGREVELNDMVIGTLIHKVLEEFALDEKINASISPGEINCWCNDKCKELLDSSFGGKRNGFIRLQEDTLTSMLKNFAEFQAQVRQEGWQILEQEVKINSCWEELFASGFAENPVAQPWRQNCTMVGKIDRIDAKYDENGQIAALRIIDYKTHAKPVKAIERLFASSPAVKAWQLNDFSMVQYTAIDGRMKAPVIKPGFLQDPQLVLYYFIVRQQLKKRGIELDFRSIEAGLWELCDNTQHFYPLDQKIVTPDVMQQIWCRIDEVLEKIVNSGEFAAFTPLFFSRQDENRWRDWPVERLNLEWLKSANGGNSAPSPEENHD